MENKTDYMGSQQQWEDYVNADYERKEREEELRKERDHIFEQALTQRRKVIEHEAEIERLKESNKELVEALRHVINTHRIGSAYEKHILKLIYKNDNKEDNNPA